MKNSKNNVKLVTIRVVANSRKPRIENEPDRLNIWVREKPQDGKANDSVILAVSKYFNVSRTSVRILRGKKSRLKVLEITE